MEAPPQHCQVEPDYHSRIGQLSMAAEVEEVKEKLHYLFHLDAVLLAMDLLVSLDHLPWVCHQTIHILHLLLDHEHLPIELVEYDMEEVGCIPSSVDLGQTGLVLPSVTAFREFPDDVGLFGVLGSIARFGLERERVLRTFSGSDSTVRLGNV